MNRSGIATLAYLTVAILPLAAQNFDQVVIATTPVTDGIYMLRGTAGTLPSASARTVAIIDRSTCL